MEQRHHPRVPMNLDVYLFQKEQFIGRFRSQNISLDGIYVQSVTQDIPRNTVVFMQLELNMQQYTLKGVVIHLSDDGMGVKFSEIGQRAFEALFYLCKRSPAQIDKSLVRFEARNNGSSSQAIADKPRAPFSIDSAGATPPPSHPLTHENIRMLVRIKERFDISSFRMIHEMIETIRCDPPERIYIDLTETKTVYDSGLALLLWLYEQLGHLRDRLYIINSSPEIREKLCQLEIVSDPNIAR